MQKTDIEQKLRIIIKREYPGNLGVFDNNTPLISSRLIDSFHTMVIVKAIEDEFNIRLAVSEISEQYLDTLNRMVELIAKKQGI